MLDLKAVRSRSPLFALSWMVLHVIDEDSPLYGATAESLMAESAEIVVVISGVDESFASRIHARHSYLAEEILFDKQFADILSLDKDGRRVVDYSRFHDLRDMEP
jgi:inward rectifier potassium channel